MYHLVLKSEICRLQHPKMGARARVQYICIFYRLYALPLLPMQAICGHVNTI